MRALTVHVGAGHVGVVDGIDQVKDETQRRLGGSVDVGGEGEDSVDVLEGTDRRDERGALVGGAGIAA